MKTRTGLFALITALLLLCAPAAFAAPETADTAPTIEDAKGCRACGVFHGQDIV